MLGGQLFADCFGTDFCEAAREIVRERRGVIEGAGVEHHTRRSHRPSAVDRFCEQVRAEPCANVGREESEVVELHRAIVQPLELCVACRDPVDGEHPRLQLGPHRSSPLREGPRPAFKPGPLGANSTVEEAVELRHWHRDDRKPYPGAR